MTTFGPVRKATRLLSSQGALNVFSKEVKRIQRNRASAGNTRGVYDYLKDAVANEVVDRIFDITRQFSVAIDVGCGTGHVAKHISEGLVEQLYQCDYAEKPLQQSYSPQGIPTYRIVCDEEFLPFPSDMFDLAVSSLYLHWVNDLPRAFLEISRVLKPGGCVVGSIFAGDTLFELRCALQLAQLEREGGFSPHISPFPMLADLGNIMARAGFATITTDIDEVVVNFPSMLELMYDIKGMGEGNAAVNRPLTLRRPTITAAAAVYQAMYGDRKSIPATFQVLHFIGWKQEKSKPSHSKVDQ